MTTLPERRRAHDQALRQFTRTMDLAAQDMRHKGYDRPQFAVVGEGSKTAQANYQAGYCKIEWGPHP